MTRTTGARGLLGFAAGLVAACLAVAMAPAAMAAPVIPPDARSGSLTIHKLAQPDVASGLPADGSELPTGQLAGLEPVAGVTFTVRQVTGIDLHTNAGWLAAEGLATEFSPRAAEASITGYRGGSGAGGPLTLGQAKTGQTGTDGILAFAGLAVGLYLVTETGFPAGASASAPFLVTVPVTQHVGDAPDTWVYDVHVYPKNQLRTAEKTVSDAASTALGDPVTWTIRADIAGDPVDLNGDGDTTDTAANGAREGAYIGRFTMVDALDARLAYLSSVVTVVDAKGAQVASLTEGADYALSHKGATYTLEFSSSHQSGLNTLMANTGNRLQWRLSTTVTALGDGIIANQATVFPNEASHGLKPGEPGGPLVTNEVDSRWGGVRLHKVDAESGADLAGAEFVVVTKLEADGAPDLDSAVNVGGVVENGHTVWTSDAEGAVVISGLRYSWYADGRTLGDTNGNGLADEPGAVQYWLAELRAPEGYQRMEGVTPIVVDGPGDGPEFSYIVENTPTGPGGPSASTGGSALAGGNLLPVLVAGVLLVAGLAAGGVLLVSRRRRASGSEDEARLVRAPGTDRV
ncbi:SpaH/EbpB family LPXTG-anchored major pilin [Propionicicella superfundia]|uniref:SpaH/EbpB family LPXTG-anchored major pilin n=1 Tax=Propionicicella superfundia TaxID=348582 RepID=UPI00048BB6EF|nr:SpaH/EbpB family LPXTG-anchored major pilin [Propionicicella superfundia]